MSHLISRGIVSTNNSSTSILSASQIFSGTAEDVSQYSLITTFLHLEPAAATGTLTLEVSTDGTNWDGGIVLPITDGTNIGGSAPHSLIPTTKYFRTKYENTSGTPQTAFRLQTMFHTNKSKGLTSRLNQTIDGNTDVDNVRAVIAGQNLEGNFQNVPLTFDGDLSVGFGDSVNIDAFSRLRVSNPELLLDAKTIRGTKEALLYVESGSGNATSVHDTDRSSCKLAVTGSGDKMVRQTRGGE